MPRRGYPLEGPRAGGLSRLADDAGISRSSLSRIVSGDAEPSVETLRALAKVFRMSLGAMMVHAGVAEPGDVGQSGQADTGDPPHLTPVPNIQLGRQGDPDPREVIPGDPISAEKGEVTLWSMTNLPWEIRRDLIMELRRLEEQRRPTPPSRAAVRRENGGGA